MASLSQEFRDKVERLERNFAVSTVIFKKFEPIFLDIFKSPADEAPRQPRSRKQRFVEILSLNLKKSCVRKLFMFYT
jgi:retinoblastoma-like protein 1